MYINKIIVRSTRRLSVLDELSEESNLEDQQDSFSYATNNQLCIVNNRKVLTKQSRVKDLDQLDAFLNVTQNTFSRSFESYWDSDRRLASISRQVSDPVTSSRKSSVSRGTLSPSITRQSSKCRPLMISSSSISSSQSHHDSSSETDHVTSDDHSTIINSSSASFSKISSSSTTLNIVFETANETSLTCESLESDNIPLDPENIFTSLERLPSSIYDSVVSSLDKDNVSNSSTTFITASIASTLTSPQCSFHSCNSSPLESGCSSPLDSPTLQDSPVSTIQWKRSQLIKSDSVQDQQYQSIIQYLDNSGCRRAVSCPSSKRKQLLFRFCGKRGSVESARVVKVPTYEQKAGL